jgi:hypothetical protein
MEEIPKGTSTKLEPNRPYSFKLFILGLGGSNMQCFDAISLAVNKAVRNPETGRDFNEIHTDERGCN